MQSDTPAEVRLDEELGLVARLRRSGEFLREVGATTFDDPDKCGGSLYREAADEIERLTAAHHAAVELSNTMHGRWIAAEAERDDLTRQLHRARSLGDVAAFERDALRKALTRVKAEAVSLADAQVLALEVLKEDKP
jgi:hypothetical protein